MFNEGQTLMFWLTKGVCGNVEGYLHRDDYFACCYIVLLYPAWGFEGAAVAENDGSGWRETVTRFMEDAFGERNGTGQSRFYLIYCW